jgi:hypothetical protein
LAACLGESIYRETNPPLTPEKNKGKKKNFRAGGGEAGKRVKVKKQRISKR